MRNTSFALAVVAGTLGLWLPAGSSSAQTLEPSKTLLNPSPDNFDLFGTSVAVSGNNLLIGAPSWSNDGAAFLFDPATGNLLQTLLNPSPDEDGTDRFGDSVAVSGNKLLVGGGGAAYLFDAATGDLLQTLLNPSSNSYAGFGSSVAVSGDYLLVGAPRDFGDIGVAYLFDVATGDLRQTLLHPFPNVENTFGYSVAALGNNLLVGSDGAAFLFDADTGDLRQTFNNPSSDDFSYYDLFGLAVAISGDNVLVGAPYKGAAYLFDAATGDLLETLLNPLPVNRFGESVAISGNNLLVGARYAYDEKTVDGAAYLFDAATGDLLQTLLDPSPNTFDDFGYSVALSGNNLLVSAPANNNQGAEFIGAVYLYQLASPPNDGSRTGVGS